MENLAAEKARLRAIEEDKARIQQAIEQEKVRVEAEKARLSIDNQSAIEGRKLLEDTNIRLQLAINQLHEA